jgi:ubiquinone/menaquinone biosynthesis C-methylase UbiE
MIARARRNAAKKDRRPPQVCFVLASLTESLPIQSASVDCILSNCVINLLPLFGKASVLKEAFRVLKPGGRIVLDDVRSSLRSTLWLTPVQIVAKQPLPEDVKNDLTLYIGCIAGAIEQSAYKQLLLDAGFPGTSSHYRSTV